MKKIIELKNKRTKAFFGWECSKFLHSFYLDSSPDIVLTDSSLFSSVEILELVSVSSELVVQSAQSKVSQ